MNDFDKAARFAAKLNPVTFFRWLLPRLAPETRGRYLVAGALLNLTGPEHPDTVDARLPRMRGYGRRERVVLRTVRTQSAAGTLRRIEARQLDRCILPWIPLMRGGGNPRIIGWWRRLAEDEPDELLRRQYAGLALIFADPAGHEPAWRQALEGLNMMRSKVTEEARAEGSRATLIRVLQRRVRSTLPADLTQAINALTDLDELARWAEAAATANSVEEFRTAVGR
jgi:hypothetical protein